MTCSGSKSLTYRARSAAEAGVPGPPVTSADMTASQSKWSRAQTAAIAADNSSGSPSVPSSTRSSPNSRSSSSAHSMARANSLSSSDSGPPCGDATEVASVSQSSASSDGSESALRPLNETSICPGQPGRAMSTRSLATAARRSAAGSGRSPGRRQHRLQRGPRLRVGRRPVRQEGLVLLVKQRRHRHPPVRQRRGHPPLLDRHVLRAGVVVPGGEPVRVDLARRDALLQVAHQPGVHLLLQRAARGGLCPDVQPDDPGRLGAGRLKPAVHVPEGGDVIADLVQDRLGRLPERRRQRVARRQQPPPDDRQRRQRVGGGHAQQRDGDIAPPQLGHPAVGESRRLGQLGVPRLAAYDARVPRRTAFLFR